MFSKYADNRGGQQPEVATMGSYQGPVIPDVQANLGVSAPAVNVAAELAAGGSNELIEYMNVAQMQSTLQTLQRRNDALRSQIAAVAAAQQGTLGYDAQQSLSQMKALSQATEMAKRGFALQRAPVNVLPTLGTAGPAGLYDAAASTARLSSQLNATQAAQTAALGGQQGGVSLQSAAASQAPPQFPFQRGAPPPMTQGQAVLAAANMRYPAHGTYAHVPAGSTQQLAPAQGPAEATPSPAPDPSTKTTATTQPQSLRQSSPASNMTDQGQLQQQPAAQPAQQSLGQTSHTADHHTPSTQGHYSQAMTSEAQRNALLTALANAGAVQANSAQAAMASQPQSWQMTNSSDVLAGVVPLSVAVPGAIGTDLVPASQQTMQYQGQNPGSHAPTSLDQSLPHVLSALPAPYAPRGLNWYTSPFTPGPQASGPGADPTVAAALGSNGGYGPAQYAVNQYGVAMPIGTLATVMAANTNNGFQGGWQLATWQPAFLGTPPTYYTTGSICGYRRLPAVAPYGPGSEGATLPCGAGGSACQPAPAPYPPPGTNPSTPMASVSTAAVAPSPSGGSRATAQAAAQRGLGYVQQLVPEYREPAYSTCGSCGRG